MRTPAAQMLLAAICLVTSGALAANFAVADNWPSFRGAHAQGVADGHALPGDWDLATGRNVRWRVEIPGVAHASRLSGRTVSSS